MSFISTKSDPNIAGLTSDSRAVEPGFLFAAIPGTKNDGRDFIADALAKGAAAVLAPSGTILPDEAGTIPLLPANNPRRQLSLLAARFYGGQPRIAAAVTGTNGKTSVAWFTRQIWQKLGHSAAAMGTLGTTADGLDGNFSSGLTISDVLRHRPCARPSGHRLWQGDRRYPDRPDQDAARRATGLAIAVRQAARRHACPSRRLPGPQRALRSRARHRLRRRPRCRARRLAVAGEPARPPSTRRQKRQWRTRLCRLRPYAGRPGLRPGSLAAAYDRTAGRRLRLRRRSRQILPT